MKCVEANVSAVTALQTPPQVFSRLSWANERPASCSFSFGKGKKSAGSKFGDKGGSAISDQRDGSGGEPVFGGGGINDWRIVPAPNQCEE